MKSIMISIKPKYCELIAQGKKTVEVRKTKPKIDEPFKCYIYCTSNKDGTKDLLEIHDSLGKIHKANSKVIGEFVCDEIIGTCPWRLKGETGFCAKRTEKETNLPNNACLTLEEIEKYAGSRGRGIYGWHISNLVIYDKPKELGEFKTSCKEWQKDFPNCDGCKYFIDGRGYEYDESDCGCDGMKPVERPFQSWGYVYAKEN